MPELLNPRTFRPGPLLGRVCVPGDKSISHRALIVGAAAPEPVIVRNLNPGRDVLATREALVALGAEIRERDGALEVRSRPLRTPASTIDCMNSGSTARMMLGVCAGAGVAATFDGDASLRRRPMEPVAAQLRAFGARITTTEGTLPLELQARDEVETRRFILITPSAQVKSALLFAGLFAGVDVTVLGDRGSRDHTERLLRAFGANVDASATSVTLRGALTRGGEIVVAGDFSSAAFFIVAATVAPGSDLVIENVGINPTRTGLLDALRAMGADITLENEREAYGEPIADVRVRHASLKGVTLGPDVALRAIDEIPVLSVAAAFASGDTKITGVRELRTKESDRVAAIERLLDAVGIAVETAPNGLVIHGGTPSARGTTVDTHDDHRTAMAAAALAAGAGALAIDSDASIDVSFPAFTETLERVQTT